MMRQYLRLLLAFTLLVFSVHSNAVDLLAEWTATPFQIDGYRVYHSVNGSADVVTNIEWGVESLTIEDVRQGEHVLWIEGYKEDMVGEPSDNVTLYYLGKLVMTVRVIEG